MHRHALQHLQRLRGSLAGLQDIAQHDDDAEPLAAAQPAAESERDAEAVIVDPVQHAPQTIAHRHGANTAKLRVQQGRVAQFRRIIVVANQRRPLARPYRLGAAADEGGRIPQAQEPRDQIAAARILADAPDQLLGQPLPRRHQLRHVCLQLPRAFGIGRPRAIALAQIPTQIIGPARLEDWRQGGAIAFVTDGAEGQTVHARIVGRPALFGQRIVCGVHQTVPHTLDRHPGLLRRGPFSSGKSRCPSAPPVRRRSGSRRSPCRPAAQGRPG